MTIDTSVLDENRRILWERLWAYQSNFLSVAEITEIELHYENPGDKRDPIPIIYYRMFPTGEFRRGLQFMLVDEEKKTSFAGIPITPHPSYIIITYVQNFRSNAVSIEEFRKESEFLGLYESQIKEVLECLPRDLDQRIVSNADAYKDGEYKIAMRPRDPKYRFGMGITLLSPETISIERAKALGQIERLVAGYFRE